MVTIFVTSLSGGAGKTAICAGIGKQLISQGKKVGYLRPLIGAPPADGDAFFMKEIMSLQEPLDALCPAFTNENQLTANFKKAFDAVAGGKDVVLIEGTIASIARAVSAKVIIVATYAEMTDGKVTAAYKSFGQQMAGVVVNKVPVSQLNRVRGEATATFGKSGVTVLGILPEDRALMTFSLAELVKLIDGQVLNSTEKTDELAGSIMLGAMTVDSALPYFNRMANKVAVIRSERPDMQMAALQTSTRALVVTGASPMIPQVQNLAEDKKVPVITTKYDVATVTNRIEEGIVKTRFHQKSKVARMTELMAQGFNFQLLSKTAGV